MQIYNSIILPIIIHVYRISAQIAEIQEEGGGGTLLEHLRGALSGGEIHWLRRLRCALCILVSVTS